MTQEKIIDYIKNTEFFKSLSPSQLVKVAQAAHIQEYAKNRVVFKEGDSSRDLYFIISGEVELHKNSGGKHIILNKVGAKNFVGEMAFIDGHKRSAKVISASPDTKVILFDYNILKKTYPDLLTLITPAISSVIINRLRASNTSNIDNIKEKLRQLKIQNEFGSFFIAVIIAIGASGFMDQFLEAFNIKNSSGMTRLAYSWIYLTAVSSPFALLFHFFKYKVTDFGVTTQNLRTTMKESLLISAIIVSILLLIDLIFPELRDNFQTKDYTQEASLLFYVLQIATYLIHSTIQEFIARGMVQTSLQRFLSDSSGIRSIVVASTLFSISHLHISLNFAALTFLVSAGFGLLYARHKNIWGVSFVHFSVGAFAIYLGIY